MVKLKSKIASRSKKSSVPLTNQNSNSDICDFLNPCLNLADDLPDPGLPNKKKGKDTRAKKKVLFNFPVEVITNDGKYTGRGFFNLKKKASSSKDESNRTRKSRVEVKKVVYDLTKQVNSQETQKNKEHIKHSQPSKNREKVKYQEKSKSKGSSKHREQPESTNNIEEPKKNHQEPSQSRETEKTAVSSKEGDQSEPSTSRNPEQSLNREAAETEASTKTQEPLKKNLPGVGVAESVKRYKKDIPKEDQEAKSNDLEENKAAQEFKQKELEARNEAREVKKKELEEHKVAQEANQKELEARNAAQDTKKNQLEEHKKAQEAKERELEEHKAAQEAKQKEQEARKEAQEAKQKELVARKTAQEAKKKELKEAHEAKKKEIEAHKAIQEAKKKELKEALEAKKKEIEAHKAAQEAKKKELKVAQEAKKNEIEAHKAAQEAKKKELEERKTAQEAKQKEQAAQDAKKKELEERKAAQEFKQQEQEAQEAKMKELQGHKEDQKTKKKELEVRKKTTKKELEARKEAIKKQVEEEKRAKAELDEINKIFRPGECLKVPSQQIFFQHVTIKHMTIEVHPELGCKWYMADVKRSAAEAGLPVLPAEDICDPELLMWTRRVPATLANFDGQVQLTATKKQCNHVLYIASALDLLPLVLENKLHERLAHKQELVGGHLTLVVVAPQDIQMLARNEKLNAEKFQYAFQQLQLDLVAEENIECTVVHTPTDLADLVMMYTRAIAEAPFKKAKRDIDEQAEFFMRGDNKNCVIVDKDGNGMSRLWEQMLAVLPQSSLEVARSLGAEYKTPTALAKALQSSNGTETIANIGVTRTNVPDAKSRKLGKEFARKLHILFTSEDENAVIE